MTTLNQIVETEAYLRSLTVDEYSYGHAYLQWLFSDQRTAEDFPKGETWGLSSYRAAEIARRVRDGKQD